jgi:RHS repeat-associated protein
MSYAYRNGQFIVQTRGPNERLRGKPQYRAYDEDVFSATGQLLSRARVRRGRTLERAEYGYDRLGNPASLTRYAEPGQSSTKTLWTWTYDSLGNVLEASEPAGVRRLFSYDSFGQISAVGWRDSTGIVAIERAMHFSYDGLARLLRSVESADGVEDAASLKEYFYDVPSGQPQQLDTAFLAGRLSFARAGGRSVYLGYDALGRMSAIARSDGATTFSERLKLDAAGATKALQLLSAGPPNETRYAYDSARRLRSVEFQDAAGSSQLWQALQTDLFGRVLRSRRGNGVVETFSYRDGGRRELQTKRTEVNGTSRIVHFDGFDGAMHLKGTTEQSTIASLPPTTTRYSFDARNALARERVYTSIGLISDRGYTYDGLGNLTAISDPLGGQSLEIRRDKFDPDRVCSVSTPSAPVSPTAPCQYRYDSTGNVRTTGSNATFYLYDGAGRMRSARAGAQQAEFAYDPLGALASLRISDGQAERRERFFGAVSETAFFDASGNPVSVGNPGPTLHRYTDISITSPAGQVAALRAADTGLTALLYPIGEAQGTRAVLDASGALSQAIRYDAYGNVIADTGVATSLTYWPYQWNGGRVLDGQGLFALGSRVLDSRTGRFLQRDPVMNPARSVTAHPYAFAWNDPVSFVDTSGGQPAARADAGAADLGAALGRFLQSYDYQPGATTDPYIDTSFACDFDHNCMRAVEEGTGGLTDFEQQLKAEFHVTKKSVWRWTTRYHVVKDRLSGAVLGYAFFMNNVEVYDRSGTIVALINNERPLETPLLDPIDFAAAGLGNFVRKKITGFIARDSGAAVESKVVQSEGAAGAGGGGAAAPTKLPPFQWGNAANFGAGQHGYTTWAGDIFINPAVKQGSPLFNWALKHEGVHRFLTPRSGLFVSARQTVRRVLYQRSHLLKYTEEVWAETAASGSLRTGLAYPFKHPTVYGIKGYRLVLEGGAYIGAGYGGYRLTDSLFGGDRDK